MLSSHVADAEEIALLVLPGRRVVQEQMHLALLRAAGLQPAEPEPQVCGAESRHLYCRRSL